MSLKADCDSLCAVSIVASIASTMIMFANGNLIRGSFVHIYVPVAIASLLFNTLGKLFIVNRTQLGRHIYEVGGNDQAAKFSGINVSKVKFIVYQIKIYSSSFSWSLTSSREISSI